MKPADRLGVTMSKPLIVSIPHRVGKEEALRRLKTGLGGASGTLVIYARSRKKSGLDLTFSIGLARWANRCG
jgi:hypothetical protein